MPTEKDLSLRCIILPTTAEYALLLPEASLVDVISGEGLDIVVDPQGGMIGKLHWRGWHVPLLSFDAASRGGIPKFNMETKTIIVHSLSDDQHMLYIALTVQGVPRRVVLKEDQLSAQPFLTKSELVALTVEYNGQVLVIPDLGGLVKYVQVRLSQ